MVTVKDIFDYLNELAPVSTKMDFDNVGLLVGREESSVKKVLVALDITDSVIEEAAQKGAQLVVSHHPLFFSLKSVKYSEPVGKKIIELIENNISAVCMHTNLDMAKCGVNTCLAKAVGIADPQFLIDEGVNERGERYGLGCLGELEKPAKLADYLKYVKKSLNANGLRFYDAGRNVEKVAVLGGSGGSELDAARDMGCDTYITADVKYDVFLRAAEYGINLIDGGHFCTENVVTEMLAGTLQNKFKDVLVERSERHRQIDSFI